MISRQIGWSQESNLLYEIGKQLDILAKVLANSGKGSLEAYPDLAAFPPVGVSGVIYLAEDTGYIYYWDGASYIQFGGGSYVPTSRQLTINGVTFDLSADRTWTISTGDDITVVANYSALPAPNTVTGQFYWCSNSQGTAWLPGTVGGTYYNSGLYYSNGTTWEFLNVPYQATQSEVNAGIISDKFVTPNTLFNSSQWATKQGALTLTTTGTSGAATLVGNTLNIPQYSGGGGMAIGGSITSATAGSVLFAGTSGVLAQDNSNIFWDNTNKRLGIGTNSPVDVLSIRKDQSTTNVATTTSVLLTNGNASGIAAYVFTSDGTTRQGGLQYNNTTGSRNLFSSTYTTIPYYFGTNNLIRLTITGDTGNILIGSTSDSGDRLQVTGNIKATNNQNGFTSLTLSNSTSGTNAATSVGLDSDSASGSGSFGKYSTLKTAYKIISAKDFYINNNSVAGDIAILNDFASGNIKFGAGGSSTVHMTIKSNGRINMSSLPTSSTGLSSGDLWNDAGTLKIV